MFLVLTSPWYSKSTLGFSNTMCQMGICISICITLNVHIIAMLSSPLQCGVFIFISLVLHHKINAQIVRKCDYAHWYLHQKMYSWNYKLMWIFQTFGISNPSLAHILNTLSNFKPTIVFHCEFGIPSKGPSSHKLTILYNNQVKSKLLKKNCFERYSIRSSEGVVWYVLQM